MKTLVFSLIIFSVFSFVPHEYYVSTFNLEYNVDEMQIEGELKVFSDDLEQLLRLRNGSALDLGNGEHRAKIMELLSAELNQKVVYTDTKGKTKPISYVGLESDGDATLIFFTIDKVKKIKVPQLEITWMTEMFLEQVNIVHFKNGEEELTEYYNAEKTKFNFTF